MKNILTILCLLFSLQSFAQTRDIPLTRQGSATGSNHKITLTTQGAATTGHTKITLGTIAYAFFYLSAQATTSVGVYDSSNNRLVRTLWSGITKPAGSNIIEWDGKDDDSNTVSAAGKYFKVLSGKYTATWQGTIGNTSDSLTGATVWHAVDFATGFAFAGRYGYIAVGYGESGQRQYKFDTANPQQKIYLNTGLASSSVTNKYVATDGTNVYWTANDSYATPTTNLVFATKVSNDSFYIFSSGASYKLKIGGTYTSAIDSVRSWATGIAVQKTGNFLFVAHGSANEVHVINKTTGALVQTLTYTAPTALCVDGSDNLWMISNGTTVAKYTVNGDGTLTAATLTLAGLVLPTSVQVSNDGNTVLVCDAGSSQQVKGFSNSTGVSSWTMGTAGGYNNSPAVTNTKFYFSDLRSTLNACIAYQADGSFWVMDAGNNRIQHFSADGTYYNNIMFFGRLYSVNVDVNNPTRVFADYLEFQVDYTSPIQSCWTLKNNWGYNIPANLDDQNKRFTFLSTLNNGRTYAWIYDGSLSKWYDVELTSTGLRFIGYTYASSYIYYAPNGNVRRTTGGFGSRLALQEATLTGFDGSGNPQWSDTATVAYTDSTAKYNPVGGNSYTTVWQRFPNGIMTTFNGQVHTATQGTTGYHLGGLKAGYNNWQFRTAYGTDSLYAGNMPDNGYFDNGNQTQKGGNLTRVIDSFLFQGYNGEFWKNSETNIFNIFSQHGLFLYQFGVTGPQAVGEAPYGYAGNTFSWNVVKVSGSYYLYHCDESQHGGIGRWKIDISSMQTVNVAAKPYIAPTPPNVIDLMSDVPNSRVFHSVGTWVRGTDVETTTLIGSYWSVKAGSHSYGKNKDLAVEFHYSTTTDSLRKTIPNISSSDWTLSGNIGYPNNIVNNSGRGQFFDILDANNKIISRIYPDASGLHTNNTVIGGSSSLEKPLLIHATSAGIDFTYKDTLHTSAPIFDATADWQHPKYIKLTFFHSSGANSGTRCDIQNFKLTY